MSLEAITSESELKDAPSSNEQSFVRSDSVKMLKPSESRIDGAHFCKGNSDKTNDYLVMMKEYIPPSLYEYFCDTFVSGNFDYKRFGEYHLYMISSLSGRTEHNLSDEYNKILPDLFASADAKAVGEMFERARGKLGLRAAARASGVDHKNLSKIEKGETDPSLKTMRKIADGIGYDVEVRLVPKGHQ